MPASAGTRTYGPLQKPPPSRRWVIDCLLGPGMRTINSYHCVSFKHVLFYISLSPGNLIGNRLTSFGHMQRFLGFQILGCGSFDKLENIVGLDLPAGEKTVDRVLFRLENFESRFQLRVCQQFDMRLMQIEECQIAAGLPQLLASKEQRGKAGRIQFTQMIGIQGYTSFSRLKQSVQFIAKIQILLPERETPFQVQDLDPFLLSMERL